MANYPDVDLLVGDDLIDIVKLNNKFDSAKDAKKHKVTRWRRNEELYSGQILKPFNLPKYKSRIEPNFIHSILETIYSILTDRNPKVDVMPKREDQVDSARIAQEAIENEMANAKANRAVANMKRDGLLYGNGFLKVSIEEGVINYSVPDPYTVFIDPLATSIEDAKCVIFATPQYVSDIKAQYGKKVPAEGALNEYKSFVKSSGKYGDEKVRFEEIESVGSQEDKMDNDYGGGQALVKEAWDWENDRLMLATWSGKTLLQKTEAPYDFIPLVCFQNYQDAHSIWGKGEPEIIESLAVGTSISLSQAMDNLIYHGNPAVVMSKSMAKTAGNRPTDKPGQVYYTGGPHESVTRLPAGNISASSLPLAESMMKMTDIVSGVHDITQGRNPSGVTASRAIQQLQEASQQIIRTKEREVGQDAIISMYRLTLNLLVNNYEQPINVRRITETGYEFEQVNPYDLSQDLDFKYIPGSSMPESRANRFDQALDLVQLGLLDQEKFCRWTQKDISKEILEEMLEQKKQQQEALQQQQQIMETSTDEDEIMNAQLAMRELMGMNDEQPA